MLLFPSILKQATAGGSSNGLLTDLSASWLMDESSGNPTDEVSSLALTAQTNWTYSQSGPAAGQSSIRNSSGGVIDGMPSSLSFSTEPALSIQWWFKPVTLATDINLIALSTTANGVTVFYDDSLSALRMVVSGVGFFDLISSGLSTSEAWYNVVVVLTNNGSDLDVSASWNGSTLSTAATVTGKNISDLNGFGLNTRDSNADSIAQDLYAGPCHVWGKALVQADVDNLQTLFYGDFD